MRPPLGDAGWAFAVPLPWRYATLRARCDRRLAGIGASDNIREDVMSARKDYTDATDGVAFVGCGLASATAGFAPASAAGTQPAARRREVVVNGRRVRTIDMHAHCAVPEAMALMGVKLEADALLMSKVADRIRAMDEQGIDVEALSINAYWYKADRDLARQLIRIQNEKLAEICASNRERFVAFASVALQHPDLAAEQLDEGMKKYGLRGAAIGGSVNDLELADPTLHPFWAKAEQLGALVFIHPQVSGAPTQLESRLKGNGGLTNVIGNPLETTIALSHLIFEGTLDRFPGLKICSAHGGGYLPSYAGRSDAGCMTFPERCTKPLKKKPTEYLRQLYFDSLVFTPEALRHLIAETGSGQIVLGTDYPFPWTKTSVEHLMATPGLSDDERVAILGGTAAKLLGLPA
jgi:aminocarboxymuconate-semialdehyde decarboxylase